MPHGRGAAEDDGGGLQGAQQLRRDGAPMQIHTSLLFLASSNAGRSCGANRLHFYGKVFCECNVQPDCAAYTMLRMTMSIIQNSVRAVSYMMHSIQAPRTEQL